MEAKTLMYSGKKSEKLLARTINNMDFCRYMITWMRLGFVWLWVCVCVCAYRWNTPCHIFYIYKISVLPCKSFQRAKIQCCHYRAKNTWLNTSVLDTRFVLLYVKYDVKTFFFVSRIYLTTLILYSVPCTHRQNLVLRYDKFGMLHWFIWKKR